MALLWLHAKILFGFLLEVKFNKQQEELVEYPEDVHPPGPAHPEDGEWKLERQHKELREEVHRSFPISHVNQLEVTQVWVAPREQLSPKVRCRLQQPRIWADPPVPKTREYVDVFPWSLFDVWLGTRNQQHDDSEEGCLDEDTETENSSHELVGEELVKPNWPFEMIICI